MRVAVIGSGPSGFYAAEHLQEQEHLEVQIDMYDRLPTPFGLVRGGVAPDHQKIKSVTRVYDKIAAHPEFRFYGNVEMGRDLTHADLSAYYHAIIYAVGARTDRRMGIPREHLPGSHSATEFVGWYNAHPDFRSLGFDLCLRERGRGRQRQRGDGPRAHPGQLARGAGGHRHRRARAPRARGQRDPRDPRPRPPRPRPGGLHQQGAQGARRAAGGRCDRRPRRRWSSTRSRRPTSWRAPTAPAIATWSCCASSPSGAHRRAQADRAALPGLAGGDHRHRARRGPHDRPQRALRERGRLRSARARPSAAPPCRWGWSSGRSATRGSRCRASPSTPCAA